MPETKPLWLLLAPVMFLLLWSGGYIVAKIGLRHAEPMTLLAIRYALVVLAMGVLFLILRPPLPRSFVEWGHLALVGLLIQVAYFGFCYLAFQDGVASGTVALIMSLQPILVALVAPVWTAEIVGWRRWTGLGLGLLGTVTVIAARWEISAPSLAGFVFCAVGLWGMTSATLWEKRFGLSHHPVTANLIGFIAGFLGVLPIALISEDQIIAWNWELAGALFYLVVGNSIVAVSLLLAMVRAGEVSRVSALLFLVPPIAALGAWLILDEPMPQLAWAGMALAGLGVWIATRAR